MSALPNGSRRRKLKQIPELVLVLGKKCACESWGNVWDAVCLKVLDLSNQCAVWVFRAADVLEAFDDGLARYGKRATLTKLFECALRSRDEKFVAQLLNEL